MADRPSDAPTRKVTAATLGGAITTVVVGGLALAGVTIPSVMAAALVVVLTFACGYITREN